VSAKSGLCYWRGSHCDFEWRRHSVPDVQKRKRRKEMIDRNIAALDDNPLGLRIGNPKGYVTYVRLGI
jgi:hypothetical protein